MASRRAAYGPPSGPAEFRALEELISFTYQFGPGEFRRWMRGAGRENARVVRDLGAVTGGLFVYPMGQWFGGRSVPCLGVAGVGIAPEHRARGAGSDMMGAVVREAAAGGFPLSALYPATQPVYRRAGYEQAGHRLVYAVAAASIASREREPDVRPARPSDRRTIEGLYEAQCREGAGLLDRSEFLWKRLLDPPETSLRAYIVHRGREALGYVVVAPKKGETLIQDLSLLDLAFRTPEAGRRILSFLASQRSFVKTIRWNGGPQDPLIALLREQEYAVERHWRWMVRICDLRRAFEARGYRAGVRVEVGLEVTDDLLPGNAGSWTLRIAGGRGRLARGTTGPGGTVACDIRALASVYTGFASPEEARNRGNLDGPAAALAALGAAFSGPTPWIREMF